MSMELLYRSFGDRHDCLWYAASPAPVWAAARYMNEVSYPGTEVHQEDFQAPMIVVPPQGVEDPYRPKEPEAHAVVCMYVEPKKSRIVHCSWRTPMWKTPKRRSVPASLGLIRLGMAATTVKLFREANPGVIVHGALLTNGLAGGGGFLEEAAKGAGLELLPARNWSRGELVLLVQDWLRRKEQR